MSEKDFISMIKSYPDYSERYVIGFHTADNKRVLSILDLLKGDVCLWWSCSYYDMPLIERDVFTRGLRAFYHRVEMQLNLEDRSWENTYTTYFYEKVLIPDELWERVITEQTLDRLAS